MLKSIKLVSSMSVLVLTLLSSCSQSESNPVSEQSDQAASDVATIVQARSSLSLDPVELWITKSGKPVASQEQLQIFATLEQFISTQKYEKALQVLKGFEPMPAALTDWVQQKAEDGHVMIQYYFARQLIEADPLQAAQWFNIAFIGSKIDSNLCAARDAHNAYLIMSKKNRPYAAPIMQKHPEYLGQAMDYAINWHEEHQHSRPQPHWICYRSVKVFDNDLVVYKKDHWPAVWEAIMDEIRQTRKSQIESEKKQP